MNSQCSPQNGAFLSLEVDAEESCYELGRGIALAMVRGSPLPALETDKPLRDMKQHIPALRCNELLDMPIASVLCVHP